MQGALKYYTDIDDPRSPRNQKHSLNMLIGTTLLASLAGIDSFSGFKLDSKSKVIHSLFLPWAIVGIRILIE